MLNANYGVIVYEAQTTVSKYVYVSDGERVFKVRFSDHPPNKDKEVEQDSDLYIGRGNFEVINTPQAILKTLEFFAKSA